MSTDPHAAYRRDSRTVRQLVEAHLRDRKNDSPTAALCVLHFRGNREVFVTARGLCRSPDPARRQVGAEILGQLGWERRSYHIQSIDLLVELLSDRTPSVVAAAATALGHRAASVAGPQLLELASHSKSHSDISRLGASTKTLYVPRAG